MGKMFHTKLLLVWPKKWVNEGGLKHSQIKGLNTIKMSFIFKLMYTFSAILNPQGNWCIYALQAPLSLEFSRWEYWSGLPFPTPEGLPNIGSRRFFNHWATWEAYTQTNTHTHSLSLSLSNMLMIKLNLPYNSTKMRW